MKNILIFNDISGLGNCSMAANLPVFTALGHYCMPVVTACYSCQTGFDNFAVTPNTQVFGFAERIAANKMPDAMYVGFCNDAATLNAVIEVYSRVLHKNVCLFVDPIMGENGKLYPVFDANYVNAMKQAVSLADCISPNLTEACLLCGVDYGELISHANEPNYFDFCKSVFADFLKAAKVKSAVITGILKEDKICNLVLDGKNAGEVISDRVEVDYSGTGDAFSSALFGALLNGKPLYEACTVAATFVARAAALTTRTDRRFGVDFCKVIETLKP